MRLRIRLLGLAALVAASPAPAEPKLVIANASANIVLPAFAGETEALVGELDAGALEGPVVVKPLAKEKAAGRLLNSARLLLVGASSAAIDVVFSSEPATLTDGRGHSIRADHFTATVGASGRASGTMDRRSGMLKSQLTTIRLMVDTTCSERVFLPPRHQPVRSNFPSKCD